MSIFTEIAAQVEAFAEAAVAEGAKELHTIIDVVTEGAADALEVIEPVVERGLFALVEKLGATAAAIVVSVAGNALSGSEKANLAVTSLTDAALQRGVILVEGDASALIKNAFTAIEERLRAVA